MQKKCILCGKNIGFDDSYYCQKCGGAFCASCGESGYGVCSGCNSSIVPFQ